MEKLYSPEEAVPYRKWMKRIERFFKVVPEEVFRWVGWASAIAALQVVDIRTGSSWLQWISWVLVLLLIGRMNWFLGLKHLEKKNPDGSVRVKFVAWRIAVSAAITVFVYLFALGLPPLIAASDLLPPQNEAQALKQETASLPPRHEMNPLSPPATVSPAPPVPAAACRSPSNC